LFAGQVGLSDAVLRATWSGATDDPAFSERQAALVWMCDELHDDGALTDATWEALRERWADDELVELVCLAGFYHLVSFLCGAVALEPEPWAAAPPVAA
jgi:hypothetical protein